MQRTLRPGRDFVLLLVYAGFVLLLAPLPAVVALATRAAPAPSVFEFADRDRDGFVDAAEGALLPGMREIFGPADLNGDGRLDRQEFGRAVTMLEVRQGTRQAARR